MAVVMKNFDSVALKRWFLHNKRDLPWRNNPSPYAVWVSEVMLQQTQVAVVIPYFERWMARLPTIKDLAKADLDEVIKLWEGLGYYSRARNLHEGARYVVENFNGAIPSCREELSKIKGLGPYTIGAIQSFAFHQKASAVDGNVLRVLTRYFHIEEDIAKAKTVNMIRSLVEEILPDEESWIINEALIELGATVCMRKAKCGICPLRGSCQGYGQGSIDRLPYKSTKIPITPLYRAVAVIQNKESILIRRVEKGKIMSGLHEFPYFEVSEAGFCEDELRVKIQENLFCNVMENHRLPEISHSFTRYRVKLWPMLWNSGNRPHVDGHYWVPLADIGKLSFSSGHRRVLQALS